MAEIRNVFDLSSRALSAQMQRLNTTASNIANADSVAGKAEDAYRPLRPVFATAFGDALGDGVLAAPEVEKVVALAGPDGNPFDQALANCGGLDLRIHIRDIEITAIESALRRSRGCVSGAAELLHLRRTTLIEKMKKYGINAKL